MVSPNAVGLWGGWIKRFLNRAARITVTLPDQLVCHRTRRRSPLVVQSSSLKILFASTAITTGRNALQERHPAAEAHSSQNDLVAVNTGELFCFALESIGLSS